MDKYSAQRLIPNELILSEIEPFSDQIAGQIAQ